MKLYGHQSNVLKRMDGAEAFGLFHDQGLGKTITTLFDAKKKWTKGQIDAVVVVAPNGVHANWVRNEIPKVFATHEVECFIYYADGKPIVAKPVNEKLQVYCFNVDGFTSPKARALLQAVLDSRRVMMVVDESQRIKNPSAIRTRFLTVQGGKAAYRRILTGTPITKGIEDLYSQFKFLGVGLNRFKSFYAFRAAFCRMGGFENKKIIGYVNQDWLQDLLAPFMDRKMKEECLDLPEKIYTNEVVPMTVEQKRLYEAVRKEAIEELQLILKDPDAGLAAAAEAAVTRLIRLRQISGGFNPYTQTPMAMNPKLDRLKELVDELGDEKVVIFCAFVPEIEAIAAALGDDALAYYGKTDARDRTAVIDRFMNDPKKKYLISNPQVGGLGLTLTVSCRMFFYSNSFDLEHRLQGEDRIHRIGQKRTCFYTDFECGPVDRKVISTLKGKNTVKAVFLKDPLGAFLAYTEDI